MLEEEEEEEATAAFPTGECSPSTPLRFDHGTFTSLNGLHPFGFFFPRFFLYPPQFGFPCTTTISKPCPLPHSGGLRPASLLLRLKL